MRVEPATILVVELGSVAFFFLVLPLMVVLRRLPAIWRADQVAGFIMLGVVLLTAFFFVIYLVGLGIVAFSGGQ